MTEIGFDRRSSGIRLRTLFYQIPFRVKNSEHFFQFSRSMNRLQAMASCKLAYSREIPCQFTSRRRPNSLFGWSSDGVPPFCSNLSMQREPDHASRLRWNESVANCSTQSRSSECRRYTEMVVSTMNRVQRRLVTQTIMLSTFPCLHQSFLLQRLASYLQARREVSGKRAPDQTRIDEVATCRVTLE